MMNQVLEQERQLRISNLNIGAFSPALATSREGKGFLIKKTKYRGAGEMAQSTRANLRAWAQIPPLQFKNRGYLWVYTVSDSSIKGDRDRRVPQACWPPSLVKITSFQFHNHKGRHSTTPALTSARLHTGHSCAHTTHHIYTQAHTWCKSVWKQATICLHSLYDISRPNHKQCAFLWIPSESTEGIAGQWKAGDPTPSLKMKRKHVYFSPKQYLNCISGLVLQNRAEEGRIQHSHT